MTPLALAMDACGLAAVDAAAVLGVSAQTVRDALSRPHKMRTPPGWLAELRNLNNRQRQAASEALKVIAAQIVIYGPGEIELGFCADNTEARSLGWPTASAHATTLRMIWEGLPDGCRLILSPRGSTPGTAAAADAHRR